MKCFYNIKMKTKVDEETGLKGLTNVQSFVLKTTGFNTITSVYYVKLPELVSQLEVATRVNGFINEYKPNPTIGTNIKAGMKIVDSTVAMFYTVGDWDDYTIGNLDAYTLGNMDVKEE